MAAMTQAETAADATPGRRGSEPLDAWISVVLVTGLVIVHLLMALSYATLPDAVFDAIDSVTGQRLAEVVVNILPALPLALVVLLWARTRYLGGLACAVVLAEALLGYLRGQVLVRILDAGSYDATGTFLSWTGWVLAALVPVAVVLAWGLARRRGRSWLPGLAVAAGVGLLVRALDFTDVVPDNAGRQAMVLALMLHVVPALAGGLVAWGLQVREERA